MFIHGISFLAFMAANTLQVQLAENSVRFACIYDIEWYSNAFPLLVG